MNNLNAFVNFNGQLVDPHIPALNPSNRALRYGDGLFETMFWDGEGIKNMEFHLDRLSHGLEVLKFDLTGGFSREFVTDEIKKLCHHNTLGVPARVRLNVFREDSPLLNPSRNKPIFIIESSALPKEIEGPLRLTLFKGDTKSTGILSNLKTNNYLLNMAAIQFASASGYDDAVILNSRGNICEASSSNVFLVQKGILFTPALTQGCVAGTKRRELLELLPGLGFQVEETIITKEMIFEMEEVFLTNAIRGVRPVICIDNTYYSRELTGMITQLLKGTKK